MSANGSSTFSSPLGHHCMDANKGLISLRIIFLLPLSIIILYLGLQKWRQQHSFKTASHSDLFTYHLAAMELVWVLGWFCLFCADYIHIAAFGLVRVCLSLLVFCGEILFHILTCVERYLAVVHPLIYRGLKNTRGVRIRNVSIGCVWLLSFLLMIFRIFITNEKTIEMFCLLVVSLIVTCYCSISVLCVLIRPGPGGGGREKERVDQSKQRAFYTITAISVALWLWFTGMLVGFAVSGSHILRFDESCLLVMTTAFLNLPSCLVSPLLYLHRTGKLTFSCCSRE